jgi:long-chain fatty acid transport protein
MRTALALAFALTLASSPAHANGLMMYGFGSRSTAMAGAVSADVDDFSANYYNPAGLVRTERLRLDLGYLYASHQLAANGNDNHVDPVRGLVGGIVAPGRLFGIPFAFGLALHLPDDRISRSRSLPQIQPRWELYDNRVQIIYIAANLAIAPFPWLRLGGGVGFVSSTRGSLEIYGDVAYPRSDQSNLAHTVDADLVSVRYPQAGVQVDVLRNLTLAVAYRGEYRLHLGIDARVDGQIVVGSPTDPTATRIPGTYILSSQSTAVFQPQQAVLGAAWRPVESLTIVADVTWVNWAAYPNPTAQLGVSLDLNIPPSLSTLHVPAVPPPTAVLPANFHDTFVPRVGAEWRYDVAGNTVAIRAGYRFDASPVPDQTGGTNFYDSNRHVVSLGLGYLLRGLRPVLAGGISIDVHGEVQVLERRVIEKADPADPVGDAILTGTVWNVGATLGVRF